MKLLAQKNIKNKEQPGRFLSHFRAEISPFWLIQSKTTEDKVNAVGMQ